jgi:hypothetical protein
MDVPNAGTRGPAPANPGVIAASGDPVNPLREPRGNPGPITEGPTGPRRPPARVSW